MLYFLYLLVAVLQLINDDRTVDLKLKESRSI